jgi:probable phosphoglycerate mutase
MTEQEYRQAKFQAPAGATEILLIRHGESRAARADDPFPLVDGQGDPELAPEGRLQAEAVGARLKTLPIQAVYATKLQRTGETAAPLCAALNLVPIINPDLHEVHLGEWEGGVLRIKAHENHPIYLQMQAEGRWDVIPGAESAEAFKTRLMRGIRSIAEQHSDQLIAVFVHGGVIGQILEVITESRPFAFTGADNGSISHIVVQGDVMTLRRFNDTAHLQREDPLGGAQLPT